MRIKSIIIVAAVLIIFLDVCMRENQKMLNPTSCLFWLMTWDGPI
jgi:hypothetical protein